MSRTKNTVVACYTLEGKLVKIYPSAKRASRCRNLFPRTIDRCIRGDIATVKGLQWKRFNVDEVPDSIPPLVISNGKSTIRPIAKIDESGEIIETYPSVKKAAELNNIEPHTLRDRINGKYRYEGKEKFRELSDEEIEKFGYQKGVKRIIEKRAIIQYTLDKKYVKTYKSINQALIELGKSPRNQGIQQCLSGKYSTAFGYIWKYKNFENVSRPKKPMIYQLDLNEKIIKKYRSVREASEETKISIPSINNCIRNRQKTAGGYIWKKK